MSIAATISPNMFPDSGSDDAPARSGSTSSSSPIRETQPQKPEYVERQQKETQDIFDSPGFDITGGEREEDQKPPVQTPDPTPSPAPTQQPAPVDQPPAQPVQQSQQPDVTTLSAAMVQALKESGIAPQPSQQQAPIAEQMSPEQFKQLTNHFEVTSETLDGLDDPDPVKRVANFNNFIEGIRKNVTTLAYHMVQETQRNLMQQVSPVLSTLEQQKTAQMQQQFATKYPQLADAKYAPILKASLDELRQSGIKFKDTNEAFEKLAEKAVSTIQVLVPDFKLTAPTTTPTKQSQTTMPAPNGGVSGGGGGAGNGARNKVPTTVASGVEVFD